MEILARLETCGFSKVGQIEMVGDHPVPSTDASCAWSSGVYAWVAHRQQTTEILYVGKAGATLRQRCRQHQGGFNGKAGSKAGLRNGAYLAAALQAGDRISIWGRESARIELFGQSVSLFSTEEEALIALFRPPLNRGAGSGLREARAAA